MITRKMTLIAALITGAFLALTIYRAVSRPAMVTAQAAEQNTEVSYGAESRIPLTIEESKAATDALIRDAVLTVPLPAGVNRSAVLVENHYTTKEVRIHFPAGASASYLEQHFYADTARVIKGDAIPDGADGMVLVFTLDHVYEVTSSTHQGNLVFYFVPPQEIYDTIVIVDPLGGGTDAGRQLQGVSEKDITLSVAEVLRERFERELKDQAIRVYFTRTWDETVPDETRIALKDAIDADLFLRIAVSDDKEDAGIRTFYNEMFFVRGLQNVTFADLVERQVCVATKKKAAGLKEAYDMDPVLAKLTIPAATVSIGSLSDPDDMSDLADDNYYRKAADGIYKAILEAAKLCE